MPDMGASRLTFCHIDTSFRIKNRTRLRAWVINVLEIEKKILDQIAFNFCSDAHLLSINQSFLNHDTLTDIITFDYSEGNQISGEVFISIDRIKENAAHYGVTVVHELHRVMIHGVLHLCGYRDKTPSEKAEMTDKEDFCLSLRSF